MGRSEAATLLLAAGADATLSSPEGRGALQLAAIKGHLPTMESLLDAGVPVDSSNTQSKTALHEVALTPQVEAAALLLARGADPGARAGDALTPLHLAAFGSSRSGEMARLLLAAGADIDARNKYRATPLVLAAQRGNLLVLEALLEAGADTTLEAMGGLTPLQAAEAGGKAAAVRILKSRSAAPQAEPNRS